MDSIINLLQLGLDGAASRQEAIANNIANVDTPNYKREEVSFIEQLQQAVKEKENIDLRTTRDNHIKAGSHSNLSSDFRPFQVRNTNYRNDKNNVDIDREMALMAKNNLYYNTLSQRIRNKINSLNNVIEKGGS